jgi:hypothetical protein
MPREGRILGPNTGFEVFVPGRQGIRAKRDTNPASGSADLHLGPPSAVSFPFLLVVSGERSCEVHLPDKPAGVSARISERPAHE